MFAIALVLAGLIALLATLQYRWLGQVSQAERERLQATLSAGASEFAQDFDRELTRAYLLFQMEPGTALDMAPRVAGRYAQWQATARFPKLIRDCYLFIQDSGEPTLLQFDPETRRLEETAWPASMANWRDHLIEREISESDPRSSRLFIARMSQPIWEDVPAIVAPMPLPLMLFSDLKDGRQVKALFSHAILTIDLDYLRTELLPSLARRHFGRGGAGPDFDVAVIRSGGGVVYASTSSFAPRPDVRADATADLFQVRTQDFGTIAADVRRFTSFAATVHTVTATVAPGSGAPGPIAPPGVMAFRDSRPLSIWVEQKGDGAAGAADRSPSAATRVTSSHAPRWKLVLRHPSGSLEAAVGGLRRRNLIVSSSILGVLGASMALLVLSTRRAQRLARQQMEFVATVSHELRTPLAVIRSAADNLAEGVIRDDEQIKKYGELMRSEGRRLTEMVEQILELAGIESGQRGFALRAVPIGPLLEGIVASSSSLIARAGLQVELTVPTDLPAVLGDEPALRRVFQNLVDNAIKYGARGGWLGVSATRNGADVRITVADRGMGIAPADQARVFEPFYRAGDAVAAQIQGAGLGLSLVRRIVDAHGGRVLLKSEPGAGSEFTVQLPAAGDAPQASPRTTAQRVAGADAPRYSS
jgi:signal transduction histidine kinase